MNDWKEGIVKLSDYMTIHPGYTFKDFKHTKYYNNQDAAMIIHLEGVFLIDDMKYAVGLLFHSNKLYSLSLICVEADFEPESEPKRKELHDSILLSKNLTDKNYFEWGSIISEYDQRGNISSISFYYDK